MSSLTDIRGIGPALSRARAARGITGPEALARVVPETLTQVRGVSPGRAQGFIDAARAIVTTGDTPPPRAGTPPATARQTASEPTGKAGKKKGKAAK